MYKPILILAGPTASGKSALALDIAPKIDAVIINADSKQVYRDIPLITAQPSAEEQQQVPHRLYGVVSAAEHITAPQWAMRAKENIDAVHVQGKIPLLVGGSGLYIQTLMQGLSPVPAIDPAIRDAARRRLSEIGNAAFHAELEALDVAMARRLHVGDTQRILRAYEVIQSTGKSLSVWQEESPIPYYAKESFLPLVYLPPRDENYRRANIRFETMMEQGVLNEVKTLDDLGLDEALPAMKAHGVPELRAYIHGAMTRADAVAKAQQNTRNYIKRQHTWFNNQLPEAIRAEASPAAIFMRAIEKIL